MDNKLKQINVYKTDHCEFLVYLLIDLHNIALTQHDFIEDKKKEM